MCVLAVVIIPERISVTVYPLAARGTIDIELRNFSPGVKKFRGAADKASGSVVFVEVIVHSCATCGAADSINIDLNIETCVYLIISVLVKEFKSNVIENVLDYPGRKLTIF